MDTIDPREHQSELPPELQEIYDLVNKLLSELRQGTANYGTLIGQLNHERKREFAQVLADLAAFLDQR